MQHHPTPLYKQLLVPFFILVFLIIGTIAVVLYGRGYRINLGEGQPKVSKTGLLVATSIPDGAQVQIDGNLTTATDNTLDLAPGEYDVRIVKEGYFPWEKRLKIQQELVTKASARLFPTAPKLESITTIGVQTPVIDPSGTKLAYTVASQSALKNGVYVYDMTARSVLSLQSAAKQIANDTVTTFSQADLSWTPDGEEVIATIPQADGTTATYLLRAGELNTDPRNVTAILPSLEEQWEIDREEKAQSQIVGLKPALRRMIDENFHILSWSPDPNDTKILYVASRSAELPLIIKPRLPGVDTLREVRTIEEGGVYVYDIKEDLNTRIIESSKVPEECKENLDDCSLPIRWFPDSDHLIQITDSQIHILEDDGTNDTTVYAGPFIDTYVFPWPNGEKLVILTNLGNNQILPNLYTIGLK